MDTHRLLSSSFLGFPYRILNMNHKWELLKSLWVGFRIAGFEALFLVAEVSFGGAGLG